MDLLTKFNFLIKGSFDEFVDVLKPLHVLSLVLILRVVFNEKSDIFVDTESLQVFEETSLESL